MAGRYEGAMRRSIQNFMTSLLLRLGQPRLDLYAADPECKSRVGTNAYGIGAWGDSLIWADKDPDDTKIVVQLCCR
jgi:hypothetical protein